MRNYQKRYFELENLVPSEVVDEMWRIVGSYKDMVEFMEDWLDGNYDNHIDNTLPKGSEFEKLKKSNFE